MASRISFIVTLVACLSSLACGSNVANSRRTQVVSIEARQTVDTAEPRIKNDQVSDGNAVNETESSRDPAFVWITSIRRRIIDDLQAHTAPTSSGVVEARVELAISPSSHVDAWTLVKASGVVSFDDALVHAVDGVMKGATPPPPPTLAGKKLVIQFRCPQGQCE